MPAVLEDQKIFVNRFVKEFWNAHDFNKADQFVTKDFVRIQHGMPEEQHGPAGPKQVAQGWLTAPTCSA